MSRKGHVGSNPTLAAILTRIDMHISYDQYKQLQPKLTAALAKALEAKLIEMGDDIKGISWFSSSASSHPKNHS